MLVFFHQLPGQSSDGGGEYGDTTGSARSFDIPYLMGKFDPVEHPEFTLVEKQYANRGGMYLRRDAYAAFKRMHAAAAKDGIELIIVSAARNFYAQKSIWEAKWTGARLVGGEDLSRTMPDKKRRALKILEYSSMPGTSRHHWGTDIDLNHLENEYFRNGEGKRIYDWLQAHAHEFGFCQPYTEKSMLRPFGYNEERWHWSYYPVASRLTELAQRKLTDAMISGFAGAEVAPAIGVVRKYVLGISRSCEMASLRLFYLAMP